MKVEIRKVKSAQIVSYFENFNGDARQWQESYFKLLEWKNTWDTVYVLDINSSRMKGAFVRVVPHNPDTVGSVIDMMEQLGYREFRVDDVTVGVVEDYCGLDEIVFE